MHIRSMGGTVSVRDLAKSGPMRGKNAGEIRYMLDSIESAGNGNRFYKNKTEMFRISEDRLGCESRPSGKWGFIETADLTPHSLLELSDICEQLRCGGSCASELINSTYIMDDMDLCEQELYELLVTFVQGGFIKYEDGTGLFSNFKIRGQVRKDFGYVYAVSPQQDSSTVKIGFTTRSPEERLREIGGSGLEVYQLDAYMPASIKDESSYHRIFKKCGLHVRGEWFRNEGTVNTLVESMEDYSPMYPWQIAHIANAEKAGLI